jgi:trigger factor
MSEQEEKAVLELSTDITTVSACERRVKVTVPRSEVERYYDNEFSELENEAYVPGFRVGKAPRKLIEKRFRKEVKDRVKQALVIDALSQVNESSEFTPISEPEFDYAALVLPDDGSFIFEFSIEVRPEFDLPNWKGLKIEKPVKDFTPEDVDSAVKRVLTNYGSLEVSTEPAAAGNYIVTKLTFKDGDTVLSSAENETIHIKPVLSFHDCAIGNFDTLMTGANAGDVVTTSVTLTDGAANADYKGKSIEAVFEIKEIKKLVMPQLTNEFLDRIGGFENEADFRDAVLDSLKRQLEHEQSRRTRKQITDLLTVSAGWELPPGLLKRQSERELRRTLLELQRSGYSQDEIVEHLNLIRQNIEVSTAQSLKEHFILEKIAEIENIEDSAEDYDTEIALIAAQSGQSPRRIRAQIEKSGDMDVLRNQIIERKVIDLINSNANFVEVPFEYAAATDSEALDWAAAGSSDAAEVDAEDLKAVNREMDEKRRIDPNVKIK